MIGRPFAFMLTGGNAADSPVAPNLLAGLKGARYLLADKGYDANSLRKRLRQSAIVRAGSENLHSGDKWSFCLTSA